MWLAPNTITLVGLMFSVFACASTLWFNPTLGTTGPRWLHLVAGLCLFVYQTLGKSHRNRSRVDLLAVSAGRPELTLLSPHTKTTSTASKQGELIPHHLWYLIELRVPIIFNTPCAVVTSPSRRAGHALRPRLRRAERRHLRHNNVICVRNRLDHGDLLRFVTAILCTVQHRL